MKKEDMSEQITKIDLQLSITGITPSTTKINKYKLDQGQYFKSLFQEACELKLLSNAKIEQIQMEIVELMGMEVERFTGGESSSVRMEKAEQLLKSISFCIGVYLKSTEDTEKALELLRNEKIKTLFHRGMEVASELKSKAFTLLKEAQKSMIQINNYAYYDTIMDDEGIPIFFHDYNIEFEADDVPSNIDYPLLSTITDLLGVEYIHEYLSRFVIENEFLNNFSSENIGMLLNGFHKNSEHMLINLFELVFNNVIGCEILGLNILKLNIPPKDLLVLKTKLYDHDKENLKKLFENALERVGEELGLHNEILEYSQNAIPDLVSRVFQNLRTDTLEEVFISFKEDAIEEDIFIDGEPMLDEKLREFIDELSAINLTSEKIEMTISVVHSLRDLTELLDECFFENEYEQILRRLSKTEQLILKQQIIKEAAAEYEDDFKPDKLWQQILFQMS